MGVVKYPKIKLPKVEKGKKLTITSREEWGAEPFVAEPSLQEFPITYVVFTFNTGVRRCLTQGECSRAMQGLQRRHREKAEISDIAFNFLIGCDSDVYEGRGWYVKSSKHLRYNRFYGKRLDIAWIGNMVGMEYIAQHLMRPAYQIIKQGILEGKIIEKYHLYQVRHKPEMKTYYYSRLYEDPEFMQRAPTTYKYPPEVEILQDDD